MPGLLPKRLVPTRNVPYGVVTGMRRMPPERRSSRAELSRYVVTARPAAASLLLSAKASPTESEGIRRTREKVELEERGTPHPHLAEGTALIRAAEKRTIRVDRREKAASLEAQREMGAHRHAQAECERSRKVRIFVTESRIRAEARDPDTAREIGLYALRLIERHCAADMQIFDVNTDGGEGISAQHRGLPTVEQLVLGGFVGARIEREREGAVVIELDALAGVDQLEAAADAVTDERTHFKLLCLARGRLRRGGRAHEHRGAEQHGAQCSSTGCPVHAPHPALALLVKGSQPR